MPPIPPANRQPLARCWCATALARTVTARTADRPGTVRPLIAITADEAQQLVALFTITASGPPAVLDHLSELLEQITERTER